MKQKKLKSESIVIGNNESTEELFQKIKGWKITSQVEFAISLDKPKRKELFEKILNSVTAEGVRENISLIFKRIEMVAFPIPDYTTSEIEYYQSFFAKDFHKVLHSENFKTHIEDKIRELFFYCNGLTIDLKTKQYDFLEDRERDKSELAEAERYKFYLENILIQLNNPTPQQIETKKDKLKSELGKYGFFELSKVKMLSDSGKQSLIELISENGLPYGIAMLDFLGFIRHVKDEYFETSYKLNKEISKWFNSDIQGRAVKGNISSLSDYSNENKTKYTAHIHKESVKMDYKKLK